MSHNGESNPQLDPQQQVEEEEEEEETPSQTHQESQVEDTEMMEQETEDHQSETANDINQELEEDLFGGDEDEEEEEEEEVIDENELKKRQEMEYLEDPNQPQHQGRDRLIAEATLLNLPLPYASDEKYWDFRLPNFLELDSQAFTDQKFFNQTKPSNEEEGDDKEPNQSKSTSVFPDQNTIRWRWVLGPDGKPVKQSNSRVVCWSDGSKSLQVGSELFDMVFINDNQNQITSQLNSKSGSLSQLKSDQTTTTQGLTYLFVRQGESQVLESQTSITGQISLRPYSLNSITHRNLVANRSMNKTYSQRQTQTVVVTVDPEMEKLEKEIEESKQFKKNKKEESKRNRTNQSNSNDPQENFGKSRINRFNAPVLSEEADEGIEEHEDEYEEEEEEEGEEEMMEDESLSKSVRNKFTELELADQRLEKSSKKKRIERDDDTRVEEVEEKRSKKKLLIIASDDED